MNESKLRAHFREATCAPPDWSGDLYFKNERGFKIRYAHAPAQADITRGTVIHRHGYGESIDLYYEAIRWYQKQGFDVWTYDLAGHGLSEGKHPNDNPSPKDVFHEVHDLDQFVRQIVKPVPGKPMVMSAHSYSAHSGLIYIKRNPHMFSAAVMSSPMFDIYRLTLPFCFRPLIQGIFQLAAVVGLKDTIIPIVHYSRLLDKVQRTGANLTSISFGEINYREVAKQAIREIHPERYRDMPTFGWVAAMLKTLTPSLKQSFLRSIRTPVLIGSAGPWEDMVATDAHERVAKIMPHAELKKMHFAVHSLWHDRESSFKEWTDHVESFLNKVAPRISPAATQASQRLDFPPESQNAAGLNPL